MRRLSSLFSSLRCLGLGFCLLHCPPVIAQDTADIKSKIRFYEDIAATLTSDELSDAALELVKNGASSDEILDEIKKHKHFAITVGSHWLEPLAILQGPNLRTFRVKRDDGSTLSLIDVRRQVPISNNFRNEARTLEQRNSDIDALIENANKLGAVQLQTSRATCNGKRTRIYRMAPNAQGRRNLNAIRDAVDSGQVTYFRDTSIVLSISKSQAKKAMDQAFNDLYFCGCEDSVVVNNHAAFRNDSRRELVQEVRACKSIVKNSMCGPDLSKCHDEGEYFFEVEEAMSLEPAAIIGKTIQDEAKFRNVVVGRKGAVNRILKRYLSSQDKGAGILNNTPGGYGDVSKVRNLPRDPKVFEWVNHKNNFGHGVGSTMAFQRATNGRRAKVNKLMQAFMCSDFKVPEGSVFEEDENPDLTKRAFCAYCHRTLEPMAKLYAKWPALGSTDFMFSNGTNSNGQFLGERGNGPRDLGKIMADSKQFKGCSVSRSFNFIFGRNMSNKEMRDIAPDMIKQFESDENLWSVMKMAIKYKAKKYYGLDI